MNVADLASIDLINMDIAGELYGDASDPEMLEMQKELWDGIRADLLRELDEILAASDAHTEETVKRTMHRVAGYSGSAGLHRCCEILRAVEHGHLPPTETPEALRLARDGAEEAIAEMERRFPHLAAPPLSPS